MTLSVEVDASAFARLGARFQKAEGRIKKSIRSAVSHTGDKARTAMRRALVPQTGLKRKTIWKAVRGAMQGDQYVVYSGGGNIRLKYFGAKETRKGVSAAPWSRRQVYPSTFMKAGWWPKRVTKSNWNGQVFRRTGKSTSTGQDKFEVVKSGLFIPTEMETGQSAAAFNSTVDRELPARIEHELGRMLGGL